MNWALWGLALLVDLFGLYYSYVLFTSVPDVQSVAWGMLVLGIFGALVLLLVRPQMFGRQAGVSAKTLSLAVPAVAFLGSLDSASISGHEIVAIFVAALIGGINWLAFRRHPIYVAPRAA